VAHVQLPDLVHAGDVRHVRGEGDSAGRRVAHEAEPAGDYRAQPIGTHHKTAVTRDTLPVTRACDDAGDTPVLPHQVLYRYGLADLSPRPRRGADDDRIPDQWEPTSATAAPHNVAARLTPSLSSQRHPPVRMTSSWQTVFARSKRASHAGHWYLPWSVAPSSESASMPATPAPVTVANPGAAHRGPNTWASQAIVAAPATPPSVPSAVIPPDVPRVTRRPDVMRRGGKGENAPISVAHVSAAAAAIAPAAAAHAPNSAATAATPPLASTCRADRRSP